MEKSAHKNPVRYVKSLFSSPLTLLWLGGLVAVVIASLIPQAGLSEMETGFGRDKAVRVITFLLLSFYPAAFFPSFRMGLSISTFMAPIGFLLEILQKYVPGRNFSPEDMIANNIGAILGIILALTIRFFFRTGSLKFRKEGGHPPRVALTPAEDPSHPMDDETKKNTNHQASQDGGEHGTPSRLKKWRSKAIILGILLILGYVGWTMITDHTQPKNPPQHSQPKSMTSPEQAVIQTAVEPEMSKPDIVEPPGEKTATEDAAPSNPGFTDSEIAIVAVSAPEPKAPASEPDSTDKTNPEVTPAPAKTPLPEISASTLTTTPEPELMPQPFSLDIAIEEPAPRRLTEKQSPPTPETATEPSSMPEKPETAPDKKADPPVKAARTKPAFSIRAGAFLEKQNAEKLVANLQLKGYSPYIFEATDSKNRTWYAVQISDHADFEAAAAATIFRNKEKKRVYITHKNSLKTVPGLSTR
jgi:VanZ family protein